MTKAVAVFLLGLATWVVAEWLLLRHLQPFVVTFPLAIIGGGTTGAGAGMWLRKRREAQRQ